MRIVQLTDGSERRLGLVDEPKVRLIGEITSIHSLATRSLAAQLTMQETVRAFVTDEELGYDLIYRGESRWRLLPAADHPHESARCMVSGTGLTHLGSASNRQAMHHASEEDLTDSMKMFKWGVEGGRPEEGQIGVAPEWFYKGTGDILRAHNEALDVPWYAEGGGEEGEIAGVYLIADNGQPYRLGMAVGNEFSDHLFEKRNYLNLAGSKLRTCSIGPELVVDPVFDSVSGTVSLERDGEVFWSKQIHTGEAEMCHSLRNLEHHHFKYEAHRRPGDVHVHFFGAHSLSFGEGLQLVDGDLMMIQFDGFGRSLRNPMRKASPASTPVSVHPLA